MTEQGLATRIAEAVDKLPPVPTNIIELRHEISNPSTDYERLLPLLKKDPGLCLDLLKFANSASYGVSHKVDTVEEALIYFGITNLTNYVCSAFADKIIQRFFSDLEGLEQFLIHSRQISAVNRRLADAAGMPRKDREVNALAGLFHDIGRLVIAAASSEETMPLITSSDKRMGTIPGLERELLGVDHCEIGALILEKWEFPEVFRQAVRRHHSPFVEGDLSTEGALIFLSHIADVEGMSEEFLGNTFPEDVWRRLGLTPSLVMECVFQYA